MTEDLISVIIIEYKNHKYLKEAVDSVLMQNYNNIELMISDDGSGDFNSDEILDYINKNNSGNIKKIILNVNKTNLGTVKHLNKIIPMTTGKYITFFAADDAMFDENTVSNIVKAFHTLNYDEYVITCQLGMYDEFLKEYLYNFISEDNIRVIKNCTSEQIFKELAKSVLFPMAGTCFRREVFEKYGYFDEQYKLVEDWTYATKLSTLGVKYNYFDFVGYKHRDGGMSHGNNEGNSKVLELYIGDCLKRYEQFYFKELDMFNPAEKIRLFRTYAKLMDKIPTDSEIFTENSMRSIVYELVQKMDYYMKKSAVNTTHNEEKSKSVKRESNVNQIKKSMILKKKKEINHLQALEAGETLVSVVVISYNSEKTITETLDSILLQDYGKLELIIADDASSDKTTNIAKKWLKQYGDRFVHAELIAANTNAGTAKNCNAGFRKCNGEYIKLIAADDILKPNCIGDMVKGMKADNADIGFCYEYVFFPEDKKLLFTNKENVLEKRPSNISIFSLPTVEMYKRLLKANIFPAPTSMIKKSIFYELGGFDENYPYTEDYPFWLKALKNGAKVTFIKSVGVYYRKDKHSISWRENSQPTESQKKFQDCLNRFIEEVRIPELERLGIPYTNTPIRPDLQSIAHAANRNKTSAWNQKIQRLYNSLVNRNVPKLIRGLILLLAPKLLYDKWESKVLGLNEKLKKRGVAKWLRVSIMLFAPRAVSRKVRTKAKNYIYSCGNRTDKKFARILYKGYMYKTVKPMDIYPESNKHWFSDWCKSLFYESKYKKHKPGEKIKVVLAVNFLFSFSAYESIYLAMKNHNKFEPVIVLLPTIQGGMDTAMHYDNGLIETMKEKGYPYTLGFDNGRWLNLLKLVPDYVVFQTPYYRQRHPMYNAMLALAYPKILYTPYGPWVMDKSVKEYIDCGIDKPFFNKLWRFFADKLTIELLEYAAPEYLNITIESGSPKVDFFVTEMADKKYCWKNPDDKSKKKIIWLPRWGVAEDRTSFLDYYEYFLDVIHENVNIDFVMRPHPFLFKDLIRSGKFNDSQLNAIISSFENADNSAIDYCCDYREGLISCDFIVADFTSLIYEFLPSGKPVIYTKKDNTLVDKRIMDACYVVENLEQLKSTIEMLINGKDELKEKRLALVNELNYFPNKPMSNGEFITNYILKQEENSKN